MTLPKDERRDGYRFAINIPTRWADGDPYGHVNNVTYYSFFDTAVHTYHIKQRRLDIHDGDVLVLVVSSACDYVASNAFPERMAILLLVGQLVNRYLTYELAVFKQGEEEACAAGRFVHVFVERGSNQPVTIPGMLREALQRLVV